MPGESIDLGELERGTRAGQAPSAVQEAATPEAGENDGGGRDSDGSISTTTSHAVAEDEVAPG